MTTTQRIGTARDQARHRLMLQELKNSLSAFEVIAITYSIPEPMRQFAAGEAYRLRNAIKRFRRLLDA